MKNDNDDASLPINDFYDSIISDNESMRWFLEKYDDIEKVELYQYVLKKAKALSIDGEANKEMISCCWLASVELEHTDAIQKYLRGEITQEQIDEYNANKEEEIQQILDLLEARRREKKSVIKQFARMFRK